MAADLSESDALPPKAPTPGPVGPPARGLLVAAVIAGVLAAALTWAAGEVTANWFSAEAVGNVSLGPMGGGGVTIATANRAAVKNAALTYAIQGAILGLLLGAAGGAAGRSARAAMVAAPIGLAFGAALGLFVSYGLFTLYLRTYDPQSNDLIMPLLAHGGVWSAIGAAGGLAFGLGVGGPIVPRVVRAALGGLIGAFVGALLYEVIGAAVFPLARTSMPVAESLGARLVAHAGVDLFAALGAAFLVSDARRGDGKASLAAFLVGLGLATIATPASGQGQEDRKPEERLSFQTSRPWSPRVNLNADVAMVYGIDPSLPDRIKTWRDRGYRIHVMTGVAWGSYQDYLYGRFDGVDHWDEAQTERDGKKILHGRDVPYISPGEGYGRYLTVGVKRALDAGAEAIHLEEPEFWARGGYEPSFQREWKAYYGEEWQPPHSSPEAQYRASKLKYFLYRRALSQIFDFVKQYGKEHGREIPCYVPTHSLINYAHWKIVSPESSLLDVGADGYIAQVWTGTSRTPNVYEGRRQERTFETAFLEYGAMQNLVRASGRRIWYLNDPIEDNPDHSWEDYRRNWENTLTASLLQPEVWRYEIMPWPDRIFYGRYPAKEREAGLRGAVGRLRGGDRIPIPDPYETELQAVIHALGNMKQPADRVRWEECGTQGTGVLVADTMMFQRTDPDPSDENLGSFYGLALPLLKRGLPVEPVQIESANAPGFLDRYRVLLLTYEGQKPPAPSFHETLARWVREGGALVVVDDDSDPYNAVREWWNQAPHAYKTPRHHLFEALGLAADASGLHRVGKGVVVRESLSPAALTYRADGADTLRELARRAAAAVELPWKETNALVLRRGPYVIAAGLDESVPEAASYTLRGRFLNLFDPELPVCADVPLKPGTRGLFLDLAAVDSASPHVVAAACRVKDERFADNTLAFQVDGIAETDGLVRVAAGRAPVEVLIDRQPADPASYRFADGFLSLGFANRADGAAIAIRFEK